MTEEQLRDIIEDYKRRKTEAEEVDFDERAAEHYGLIIDDLEACFDDYLEHDVDPEDFKHFMENIIIPKPKDDSFWGMLGIED